MREATGVEFDRLLRIHGSGPSDVWAIVNGSEEPPRGTFIHWDGIRWETPAQPAVMPSWSSANSLWVKSPTEAWATDSPSGRVLRWDGAAWTIEHTFAGRRAESIWSVDDTLFVSTGTFSANDTGARLYRKSGSDWVVDGSVPQWSDILWGASQSALFAGGNAYGGFGHLRMRGETASWSGVVFDDVSTGSIVSDVGGSGPADVWAVGGDPFTEERGFISHFDGQNWSSIAHPLNVYFVSAASERAAWAMEYGGGLIFWDGVKWAPDPHENAPPVNRIWAVSETELWAACGEAAALCHLRP